PRPAIHQKNIARIGYPRARGALCGSQSFFSSMYGISKTTAGKLIAATVFIPSLRDHLAKDRINGISNRYRTGGLDSSGKPSSYAISGRAGQSRMAQTTSWPRGNAKRKGKPVSVRDRIAAWRSVRVNIEPKLKALLSGGQEIFDQTESRVAGYFL